MSALHIVQKKVFPFNFSMVPPTNGIIPTTSFPQNVFSNYVLKERSLNLFQFCKNWPSEESRRRFKLKAPRLQTSNPTRQVFVRLTRVEYRGWFVASVGSEGTKMSGNLCELRGCPSQLRRKTLIQSQLVFQLASDALEGSRRSPLTAINITDKQLELHERNVGERNVQGRSGIPPSRDQTSIPTIRTKDIALPSTYKVFKLLIRWTWKWVHEQHKWKLTVWNAEAKK